MTDDSYDGGELPALVVVPVVVLNSFNAMQCCGFIWILSAKYIY